MTVTRTFLMRRTAKWDVQLALATIGVPRQMVYAKRHLGNRQKPKLFAKRSDLWRVADAARTCYRNVVKLAHPDAGGSHEQAVLLNHHWDKLKRWFGLRGITL